MNGWHFTNGMTLRDGQPLVAGKTYRVDGPLKLCERGLHASERAIDALRYAPGAMVSRVRLGGMIVVGDDKACATERTVLWCADATTILRQFAIACATNALEHVAARGYKTDRRSYVQAAQREAWAARSALANAAAAADAAAYAAYAYDAADAADARRAMRDSQNAMLETMLLALEP